MWILEELFHIPGMDWHQVVLRLVMSMIFGGIIGIERGIRRRPAGFRTYMLVCVGATLVMMTNEFIVHKFGLSDPARLGAQVVNGIGFLGAGTIIVTRNQQVKGLTTAAGLWASACMGLAIGIGFYAGAIFATLLIFLIITLMHTLDYKVISATRAMEVYVELEDEGNLSDVLGAIIDRNIRVVHVEIVQARYGERGTLAAIVTMRLPKRHPHYDVVSGLREIIGVQFLEEI